MQAKNLVKGLQTKCRRETRIKRAQAKNIVKGFQTRPCTGRIRNDYAWSDQRSRSANGNSARLPLQKLKMNREHFIHDRQCLSCIPIYVRCLRSLRELQYGLVGAFHIAASLRAFNAAHRISILFYRNIRKHFRVIFSCSFTEIFDLVEREII